MAFPPVNIKLTGDPDTRNWSDYLKSFISRIVQRWNKLTKEIRNIKFKEVYRF
jgi:hypothetical protein